MAGATLSVSFTSVMTGLRKLQSADPSPKPGDFKISEILREMKFLEMMNATVCDAEDMEFQVKKETDKLRLRDLRQLAYRAGDLLDSYRYKMYAKEAERERSGEDQQVEDNDRDEVRCPYLSHSVNAEFVRGLKDIKEEFYKIRMDLKPVLKLCQQKELNVSDFIPHPETTSEPREAGIFGREKQLEKLVELLYPQERDAVKDQMHDLLPVIAVVGEGGVGKTTLVQLAHDHPDVSKCFDVKLWLIVSRDGFDPVSLTRKAVESLAKERPDVEGLTDLQNLLKDKVKGKKFLLVMVDVWNDDSELWKQFLIPFRNGGQGSRILLTTPSHRVANSACAVKSMVIDSSLDEDGRHSQVLKLVGLLLQMHDVPPVIAVVGMGGVGKTTLVQHAYNHTNLRGCFDVRVWVYVSRDGFNLVSLTKKAVESLTGRRPRLETLDSLQMSLEGALEGKRFLLVMDDVWNVNSENWEKFMIPLRGGLQGSKIIVTTRSRDVGHTALDVEFLDLESLSEEDGWSLFRRHAFRGSRSDQIPPELEDMGKKIAKRCDGLPLAIRTVAGILYRKTNVSNGMLEGEWWRKVLGSDMWDIHALDETEGREIIG